MDDSNRPAVEAAALWKMYRRGYSGEAIFELVIPRALKDCAGDARSFEFRRAVLREFVRIVKRRREKAGRACRRPKKQKTSQARFALGQRRTHG